MKRDHRYRSWAEVHIDRLGENLGKLRAFLPPGCLVMGVVKANAYGHGDGPVSAALLEAGADWLAVSTVDEALSLRRQGIGCPLLVLVSTPPELVGALSAEGVTQTVYSAEYARRLRESAMAAGVRVTVHIKVDTGMSRLGFSCDDDAGIAEVCAFPEFEAQGIYTHFASADEVSPEGVAYTRRQFELFSGLLRRLEERGLSFPLRHCCNSAGVLRYPEYALDMVRPGIALYGALPSRDCEGIAALSPVMEWKAAVSMVKTVGAGISVSYGRKFTARTPTEIATVPVGYADGYGREQSGKGVMAVRGATAKVTGRVCMDQLMLDVSAIPGVRAGDIVEIVGGSGAPTWDEMADIAGTIGYEKLCAVGRRIPRIYYKNGAVVGISCDLYGADDAK